MDASRADATGAEPVERFKPTSGMLVGYAGLAVVVAFLVYVVVSVHTVTGLRLGLALAFVAVVTWVTQLRPRATAYPDFLRLKNALRDTDVPLALIEDVTVRNTLNVWVGDARYICIGIGKKPKSMIRGRKRSAGAVLGASRLRQYAEQADRTAPDQSAMHYETFVVTRIEELVDAAKREQRGKPQGTVRKTVVWPEMVALVVLGLAFVVSLFL
jgi:hypothetical protein